MAQISYKDAGVDTAAGARAVGKIRSAVQSTYTADVIGDIGGFGGLFSAASIKNMEDPVLVSATDGVGTKLELAKRTGDYSTVGIDLVAMCVNDLVVTGAKPLFFLDYLAVGKLDEDFAAEVVGGVAEGCRQAGCALIGGEMAEHPGVMQAGDYDLAGFAVGVVERAGILSPDRVRAGDQIIGLASTGLHSNGFSLVRKAFTDRLSDMELAETILADGRSLGQAVMAPTQIYVEMLLAAYQAFQDEIRAAANITGGGITENLDRALPVGCDAWVDLTAWPVPEVISMVIDAASLSQAEALKTFNMGIGMAVIVAPEILEQALQHFSKYTQAYHIGECRQAQSTEQSRQIIY
ncbi:MAG: phosphoribosylformylglycinamidine cyclo-ligase [Coriobacteriia bacterium]|nr:phosphoribosylformylglycinamidine cyclo-ligase [Coriobacteriia bacterium]